MSNDHASVMAQVRTLLAIANGGSPYPHEQDRARERAERLMLRHSIDEATVAMTQEDACKPVKHETPIDGSYALDKVALFTAVYLAFGCQTVRQYDRVTRQNTVLAYGFAHDVEMATTLCESLLPQMVTEMMRHGGPAASRKSFAAGFALKVNQRLKEFYAAALTKAESEGTGSALVLANRDALVTQAKLDDNPGMQKGRKRTLRDPRAWAAGQEAGKRADIALGERKVAVGARHLTA